MHWWFIPIRDEDVLVHGERVLYRSRRHWAAIFGDLWQFLAVVFLRTALAIGDARGLETVLLFGTIISLIVLWPLFQRRHWGVKEYLFLAVLGLWILSAGPSINALVNAVVAAMFVRFLVRALRWGFFQRLYLTDRRLMEVDGFLGIKVNSMPLAKVTDIMMQRTPMGEILGYGTFRVESAGQDQALGNLTYLLDPEGFHTLVVSSPSWTA